MKPNRQSVSPDFLAASGSSPPPQLSDRVFCSAISDRGKVLYGYLFSKAQYDWEYYALCESPQPEWSEVSYEDLAERLRWTEEETRQAADALSSAGYIVIDEGSGSYSHNGEIIPWSRTRFALTTEGVR